MTASIIEFLRGITNNDYLTLFLISIIPIIELRGAIVIMAGMSGINMVAGMFCCVAGSTTVILPLLLLIRPIIKKLKGSKLFAKFGNRIEKTLAERAGKVHGNHLKVKAQETIITVADVGEIAQETVSAMYDKPLNKNESVDNVGKIINADSVKKNANAHDTRKNVNANFAGKNMYANVAEKGKNSKRHLSMEMKKFIGLFVFVAIPLPLTGAWTGSCVGSFMGLPIWKAAVAVFLGNVAAAFILTCVAALLPIQYVDFLLYGFVILAIAIAMSMLLAKSRRRDKKLKATK